MNEKELYSLLATLPTWSKPQIGQLRNHLDRLFPTESLVDFNLEAELLQRYKATTELWDTIVHDESVPANQKAQVMNACSALLEKISKLQVDIYDSERLKTLERAFIDTLKQLPNQQQALDLYEEASRKLLR